MTAFPLAGVVGQPVGHSRSPRLHRHWLARHGIPGDYVAMDVGADDLRDVLRMLPKAGFRGVNVTIPHKRAALELADEATERATRIGAANLLVFEEGRILADNTDGEGFVASLRQGAPGWDPGAGPAAVLGAGGAARAVIAALLDAGVPEVILANRTRETAEVLRDALGERLRVMDWTQAGNAVEEGALVVNTTSLGMTGKPELRVPLDGLRPGQVVTDLVYAPLETRLLREARAAGAVTVDGLGMLLHQAVLAFERWFGVRPEVDDRLRAAVLGVMPFVLGLTGSIGMGKSTTAAMFRDEGLPVWDADAVVHWLYGPGGAAVPEVAVLVPDAIRDGAVERSRLREALEQDPALFSSLEAIVHPLVARDRRRFLDQVQGDIAVLDVPLLFERGIDKDCDGVAVASASPETQMRRLLMRPGLDRAGAELLLSRQMPDEEKRARARWVVPSETLEEARTAVRQIIADIRREAGAGFLAAEASHARNRS